MIQMKPFSKTDWYGFAGATSFPDGSAPLIGECQVGELGGMVIIDAFGLSVVASDDEGENEISFFWDPEYAGRALAGLNGLVSVEELKASPGCSVQIQGEDY
jgi:hypothetical protein